MLFADECYEIINQQVRQKVVLLPLGAIEQHGPHLPVATDSMIVSELAAEIEKRLPEDILLCPTLSFGSSHHHLSMGGTISISVNTYTQLIVELVESFIQNGFRHIVLLNSHGGNITPVRQALSILSSKHDATIKPNIALITYWELAGKIFSGAPPMESPALSHACEYETSLILHLFPEKVLLEKLQRSKKPGNNDYVAWEEERPYRGVTMIKLTEFISSNGSSGEPHLGSSVKGKYLFDNAVTSLVEFISAFKTWPLMESLAK